MITMAQRPIVVVSDLHLQRGADTATTLELAELVRAHPDHEVVLNGDVFNLSHEPIGFDPAGAVTQVLTPKTELLGALKAHLRRGSPVTLLAGNHDAAVASLEA